ncbi:lysophospholipid acyltransferase family protein [Nocardioides sp. AE5]|uniref:lysophospholipid acyltransferase family protein n=1 Tax=Nocardioides sp. AE5 TaxID=2962573 RepID=UPI0028814B0B|nr:lysophospholipid acyltransferase family protein [Nocardioides sp. AE5]MDT0202895.1 lysophospholipid acyltransferase family protein [Nocardioides sp. AE5]
MSVRKVRQRRGWAVSTAVVTIKPAMRALARRNWIDGDKVPAEGGCIIALNHITKVDPLMAAYFVYDHGRIPRFMAKDSLFDIKGVGNILRSARQIPVKRMTGGAADAFSAAVDAVRAGECVIIYVEGTITRDPDLWPMKGKSGAARIALETGCPVIPVAHWGVQEILAPYAKKPDLFPRKDVTFKAGDPVDLDDLVAAGITAERTSQATERIIAAITSQLEDIRGEKAPAERFDPRAAGVKLIGNPNEAKDDADNDKDKG